MTVPPDVAPSRLGRLAQHRLWRILAVAIAYYVAGRIGLRFATVNNAISPLWPPAGIAMAALLWGGPALWPGVLLGAAMSAAASGLPLPIAFMVAVASTLEALAGMQLTRRLAPGFVTMERPRDFFVFVFAAALPAAALGATLASGLLMVVGVEAPADWVRAIGTWLIGDWTGTVAIVPFLLAWGRGGLHEIKPRLLETALLLVLLTLVVTFGLAHDVAATPVGVAVRWALFPVLAWASVRFGLRGSSACILVIAAVSAWATVNGRGPFGGFDDPIAANWRLGGFLALVSSTAHAIAFLSAARELTLHSLEVNRRRLHGVVNTAMDAIIMLDAEERIQVFNPAAEQLLGWPAEEVLGTPVQRLIPERHREAHRLGFAGFRQSGVESRALPHRGRLFGLRRDGAEIALEATVSQFEADGERFFTMIMHDISERLASERALRASEARFDAVLESMGDIAWSVSLPDEHLLYCSAAAERVYGVARSAMMNGDVRLLDTVHPADRAMMRAAVRKLQTIDQVRAEHRIARQDGEVRWLRVRMSVVRDASGVPVRVDGVSSDITEARHLEAQLRESQKLEAVGTLAGGIAHDFNNILAAISGNAELLLDDDAVSGEPREQVSEILLAARRARDLSQRILMFSGRRETAERLRVELAPALRETLQLIRATVPSTVRIECDPLDDRMVVHGDATQLHQVVANLCTNAWHAMREGGTMSIRLARVELDQAEAGRLKVGSGGYARLTVADNGTGMAEDVRERIFEPFFTTKAVGEGSGLGLSVVRGIVTEHGGAITVDSAPGKGSRFDVYLPLSEEPVLEVTPIVAAPASGGGLRVLLVDDEPSVARVITLGLQRLGFVVSTFDDPMEALDAIAERRDAFDAVVTDLTMPGLTGIEFARRTQAVRADLPFILYSGDISSAVASAREAGIREVLEKPVSLVDLAAAIRRLVPS